ncbi:MAG: coproporphyrinogen dehydrogenase HemZ [Lachnospiraceae bacterium]|nr:coproporphyrinogen dehydrogenase HemZ [Lachnospiraceae bacterium]
MYIVKLNEAKYEYEIHSLVKAFYPEEEVRVLTPDSVVKDRNIAEERPRLEIFFDENSATISGEAKERRVSPDTKEAFGAAFYKYLSEFTKKELPWGNLTGIRPTKIALTMLEAGKSEEEILRFLREKHFVSERKALLGIDIAKREREILAPIDYENGYSLYIGIPFCPTTCLYCSFTSFPIVSWRKRVGEYLTALQKEIDFTAEIYRDKKIDTVYIGGGTPTTLEAEELERLLSGLERAFDLTGLKEFTVEAGRADSITAEKLSVLKAHGVTRISVNPQTMKDETLKLIGRRHTVDQVREAFYLAREAGFANINMDMILGLPGEGAEDVAATIEALKELSPDSLTVHSLAVKRASHLRDWIGEHGFDRLQNTEETMDIAAAGAKALSMKPYYLYRQKNMTGNLENVGYAREGCCGIYNILIMEEKQTIVALGAGTISKRVYPDGRIERRENVKDVAQYIQRIDEMIERKRVLLED